MGNLKLPSTSTTMSFSLVASIFTLQLAGSTIDRNTVSEQIGVKTIASTSGSSTEPPAESEYPVEPVCVETINPSASH